MLLINGLNASGKTTFCKKKIINNIDVKKIDSLLYFIEIVKHNKRKNVTDIISSLKLPNNHLLHNNLKKLGIDYFKNSEDLSTGQKKKCFLAILLSQRSKTWYFDEPTSYLDKISLKIMNNQLTSHLNKNGLLFLTTNTEIQNILNINIAKKRKISLSRIELLTTRLSSECSTTEL